MNSELKYYSNKLMPEYKTRHLYKTALEKRGVSLTRWPLIHQRVDRKPQKLDNTTCIKKLKSYRLNQFS